MRRIATLFALVLSIGTISAYGQCGPLTTIYAGNNGQDGIMFDIVALNGVEITGFDFDCYGNTHDIEIYHKVGTHIGFETNAAAWTLIGSANGVVGNPRNSPTPLPIVLSQIIPGCETHAFYITSTSSSGSVSYTNGAAVGAVFSADANIQILEGTGKDYPFNTSFTPRVPNMTVYYNCVSVSSCCPAPNMTELAATCPGVCDGEATGTVVGGVAPLSYLWDAAAGSQTTQTATGLCAGTYTLTVTDGNGCPSSNTVTVTEPTALNLTVNSVVDATCGGNNGSVDVTASGGTVGYTYDIGGAGQASGVFTGLSAGSYTVTVTDANGCQTSQPVTINNLSGLSASIASQLDVDCYGNCTGEADVSAAGGTPPYSYDIGSGPQGSGLFTGLCAGAYTVDVQDALGCAASVPVTIIEPSQLNLNLNGVVDASCGASDGSIDVSATGGTAPYTYDIGTGGQASGVFTGLAAGSYTVDVVDANGCTTTVNATVNGSSSMAGSITVQTDVTCNGQADGSVSVTGSGGVAPYTYDIGSGQQASGVFTGLAAGAYTVDVYDANMCSVPVSVTINEPTALNIFTNSTVDLTCNGYMDGQIEVVATGGSMPYSFDNGGVGQPSGTFTGLSGGSHTITVTDLNGCTNSVVVNLNEPPVLVGTIASQMDASCNGACDGELNVSAAGGTPGYTYDLGAGPVVSGSFIGLCAGSYVVDVVDANGCMTTVNATIAEPAAMNITLNGSTDATCGNNNGSLDVSASGGSVPYTYDIGGTGQATGVFNGLTPGSYVASVTDGGGCSASVNVVINDLSGLTASLTSQNDVSCAGSMDGQVEVVGSGSYAPYTYDIGTGPQSSGIFTGLAAGNHSITVTDSNNCTFVVGVLITEPTPLNLTLSNTSDVTCNGLSDGSLLVNATGGTGPYTYDIGAGQQASPSFSGLPAGSYDVTVTDAQGCSFLLPVSISEPVPASSAVMTQVNADCVGSCNGSVNVAGSGGTSPFSYDIGYGPQPSGFFAGLCEGTYMVTTTDANGCVSTSGFVITANPLPAAVFAADTTEGCDPLEVTFTNLNAGTFSFWDFGDGATVATANGTVVHQYTTPGCYDVSLTVQSPSGCISTATYPGYVCVHEVPNASFTFSPTVPVPGDNEFDFTNLSTGASSYIWTFGDGQGSNATDPTYIYQDDAQGYYTVTLWAISAGGCVDSTSATIGIQVPALFYIPNGFTPDGDPYNQTFQPVFTEGFDPMDYTLTIFNQWGEILFVSHNAAIGWDGTYVGQLVPEGVYVWQVEYKATLSDDRYTEQGHVTLLR